MFDTFDDLVGASDNSSLDSFDLQISIGDYDNESTTSSFEFMDVKLALKSFIILNNSGEMETVKSKRFKKPSLVQTTDFFGIEFEDASYENRITRIRFQDILLVQRQWDFMVNFYFGQAPSMSVWDTLNDEFRSVTPANNDTPFRLCHYLQCALSGHVPNRAALPSDVTRDDKESTNMNSAFEYSQNDADPDETRSPTEKNLDVVFEYVKNNLFDLHEDTPNVFYYEKNIFVSLEEVKETSDRFSLVDSTDSLERYLQPAAAYQTSATQPRNKTQNPLDANAEESEDEEDEEDEDEEESEEEKLEEDKENQRLNRVLHENQSNEDTDNNRAARRAQSEMEEQIDTLYHRWHKILPPKMKTLDQKIIHDILVLLELQRLRAYQLFPEMIRVLSQARTPYEVGRAKLLIRALSEKPTLQLRNMRQVRTFLRSPLS